MANQQGQNQKAPEQQKPVIADEGTMTTYGITLGEIIADSARENQKFQQELNAKTAEAVALAQKVAELEKSVTDLTEQKAMIAMAGLKSAGFERLVRFPDGSIRFPVTLDIDQAASYLDQAESSGEDQLTYIQRQVSEALGAYGNAAV